jgi:hypothetical protein
MLLGDRLEVVGEFGGTFVVLVAVFCGRFVPLPFVRNHIVVHTFGILAEGIGDDGVVFFANRRHNVVT